MSNPLKIKSYWEDYSCGNTLRVGFQLAEQQVCLAGQEFRIDLDGDLYGEDMWFGAQSGDWEASTVGFVVTRCRDSVLFIDIGAASGIFSLLAGRFGARVLSVEPDPRWLACLYRNIQLNDMLSTIRVVAGAVSNVSGNVSFLEGGSEKILSPITRTGMSNEDLATQVEVHDLVELLGSEIRDCPNHQPVLKMDIEGAEYPILWDSRQLGGLQSLGAIALISLHPKELEGLPRKLLPLVVLRFLNFANVVWAHRKLLMTLVRFCSVADVRGETMSSPLKFGIRVALGEKYYVLDFRK